MVRVLLQLKVEPTDPVLFYEMELGFVGLFRRDRLAILADSTCVDGVYR